MTIRTRNADGTEVCVECEDDGWVEAYTQVEPYTEAMAPCPFCQRGFAIEFPENGRGPWGPAGYWRGRTHPHRDFRDKPLSKMENAIRVQLLLDRHARQSAGSNKNLPDPCAALSVTDERDRMEQLLAHANDMLGK